MADNVNRFLGGPPLAVLGKLILLSILIGVVLSALGLDPLNIFSSLSYKVLPLTNPFRKSEYSQPTIKTTSSYFSLSFSAAIAQSVR